MMRSIVASISLLGLLACGADNGSGDGDEAGESSTGMIDEDVVDERVDLAEDGPGVLNFIGAEFVVQPGEETIMCMSIDYEGGDIAYRNALSFQGKGGHHVILLGAKEPQPAGTVEECLDGADMSKYDLLMVPQELPVGYGTRLPGGRHMVIQSHYINTTDKPMLVRDVVQLDLIAMEDVQTWSAPIATNTIDLVVPAGETSEVTYDCVLEQDVDLLMLGGHMHEWGTKFQIDIGPSVDELELLYLVDPWQADFRDVPPVTLFLNEPRPLAKGTILRISCGWENTEPEELIFPFEMCAAFGLVAGVQDPIECRIGE